MRDHTAEKYQKSGELKANEMRVKAIEDSYINEKKEHVVKVLTRSGKEAYIVQTGNASSGDNKRTGFASEVTLEEYQNVYDKNGNSEVKKVNVDRKLDKGGVLVVKAKYSEKQDGISVFKVEKEKNGYYPSTILAYDEEEAAERAIELKNSTLYNGMIIGDFEQKSEDEFDKDFSQKYSEFMEDGKGIVPVYVFQPINEEGKVFAEPFIVSDRYYDTEKEQALSSEEAFEKASEIIEEKAKLLYGEDTPNFQIQSGKGVIVSPEIFKGPQKYAFQKVNLSLDVPGEETPMIFLRQASDAFIRLSSKSDKGEGIQFAKKVSYKFPTLEKGEINSFDFVNAEPDPVYLDDVKNQISSAWDKIKEAKEKTHHTKEEEENLEADLETEVTGPSR